MSVGAEHALKKYQTVGAHASVAAADPYRLVQLMLDNVLQRVATAQGHMERGEVARKGEQVSKAIGIIGALNAALNMEAGGEISANLRTLYDHCTLRLVHANRHDDAAAFDEVTAVIRTVKEGWDGIGDQARTGAVPESR